MVDSIDDWLEELGLEQYAGSFRDQDVDLRAVVHLTDSDLKELGVTLGHRRILMAAIAEMDGTEVEPEEEQEQAPGTPPAAAPRPSSETERRRPTLRAAEDAERRQITCMFCDLVGSTALTMRIDPEELREILRRYQNAVTNAVVRYGGYVARFSGDGVLAYFGWPHAYEDQAERGVRAALEAIPAVSRIRLADDTPLAARIGIATGQVVVGDLVGKVASDFKAVTGETPNLAARLQDRAASGQIVIGATTRRLVGTAFTLEDLGQFELKGFTNPVNAWAVLGEGTSESRFEAARGSTLSELVGRDQEFGLLGQRWELARGGEGQGLLLVGEPGIGKSRLVQDFRNSLRKQRRFNLHFQCSPHHASSAFYPVIQRLHHIAGFAPGDGAKAKIRKLETLLKEMREPVETVGALFASLLSIRDEERFGKLELTPQQFRARIIEAMVGQVVNVSRQRPVVFVVEDAHWLDPSTADFVGELMPRIAEEAVLMLITCRPENAPRWASHSHVTSIMLNRLGRRQAARIVQSISGERLDGQVLERIVERTDGVPLYVEELTRWVLENAVSSHTDAVFARVPASLQSSLEARLDKLGSAKEIAQVAAVIGREFSLPLLSAVAKKTDAEIQQALDALVDSGLAFRRGVEDDAVYTFKHALLQDAAYGTMLHSRRRSLHASLVEVIERRMDQDLSDRIDALAHHAFQSGVWDKAFMYLKRAGVRAMDRAAIREAVVLFERALHAGSQLPESRESVELAIDLRFELRNAQWSIGAFGEILDNLAGAETLAKKIDDPRRLGWCSVFSSASLWQLGRPTEALAAAGRAVTLNKGPRDLALSIGANFYLGCAHITSGDYRRAEGLFQEICDALPGELSRERCGLPFVPSVIARSWLVWSLAERGEFELGDRLGREALAIADEVGHPFNIAHIYYDLGYFHDVRGDHDQAVAALERSFSIVREWSLTYLSPFIKGFLGHATAMAGEVSSGTLLLEQAAEDYETMGLGLFRSMVGVQLGEALLLGGRLEEAHVRAEWSLDLARKRAERGHEAWALHLLGQVAAVDDSTDDHVAAAYLAEALAIAGSLEMRPLAAHCHGALGRLPEGAVPDHDPASHAATAAALYEEMDMDHGHRQTDTAS